MIQLTRVLNIADRCRKRRRPAVSQEIGHLPGQPRRGMIRWPVILIALPAAVATWSGWVGLGRMVGFGVVTPLPGIADEFTIDTSITLPIGVEAYAGYALAAWLSETRRISRGTRTFAALSATASLLLGMLGQIAYHRLVVAGYTVAPPLIVNIVSCLPVLVLGMAATLHHLLARDARAIAEVHAEPVDELPATAEPEAVDAGTPTPPAPVAIAEEPQVNRVPEPVPAVPLPTELQTRAAAVFFIELAAGQVPKIREIKDRLNVGQDKAQMTQAYLASIVA